MYFNVSYMINPFAYFDGCETSQDER